MQAWQAIAAEEDMSAMHAEWQTPFKTAEHPEATIYENFPAFDQAIIERINTERDVPWVTVSTALEDAKAL